VKGQHTHTLMEVQLSTADELDEDLDGDTEHGKPTSLYIDR